MVHAYRDSIPFVVVCRFRAPLHTDNSSDYAKGIAKSFRDSFTGEIVADETFVAGDTDFQAALTKIKDKDFDAIVFQVTTQKLVRL